MKLLGLIILFLSYTSNGQAQKINVDSINNILSEYKVLVYSDVFYSNANDGMHFHDRIMDIRFNSNCTVDIIYYRFTKISDTKTESETSSSIPLDEIKLVRFSNPSLTRFTHKLIKFQSLDDKQAITCNRLMQKNDESKDNVEKVSKTSSISLKYEGEYLDELIETFNELRKLCNTKSK